MIGAVEIYTNATQSLKRTKLQRRDILENDLKLFKKGKQKWIMNKEYTGSWGWLSSGSYWLKLGLPLCASQRFLWSESLIQTRCFRSWNSVPHPGISQCTFLPVGSFSGCSGQIQEPKDMLMNSPWFTHFPSSMVEPTWPEPGSPRHRGQFSAVQLWERQLQNASGFCVTHLFWLRNGQRGDCSCVSQEGRSSYNKQTCIADSLWYT